ncbi:MAG: CRTAC1 family protein [Verrucomicrobiota bacterium]
MASPPRANWMLIAVLLFLAASAVLYFIAGTRNRPVTLDRKTSELVKQVAAIESAEREAESRVWPREQQAQMQGQLFEQLWDALNRATNRWEVLAAFGCREWAVPTVGPPQALRYGIEVLDQSGSGPIWHQAEWREFLKGIAAEGWQIEATEFRHVQFDGNGGGQPERSRFYFSFQLTNRTGNARAVADGFLIIDWAEDHDAAGRLAISRIAAEGLSIRRRQGTPGFRELLVETIAPPDGSFFIDPLIVYDLNNDGVSEIILAAKNLVYERQANGSYHAKPLCAQAPGLIFTALVADFDGDGTADLLCAKFEGLFLYKGSGRVTFEGPPELAWAATPHLKYGQAFTCGDIDQDGDLDVWLGQYKVPYARGQMPTPFYDANDGYPSYLLLNDGRGTFTDATSKAGLGAKRWRRAYSASFTDLDQDGLLDLVTVSDFAGLELYRNEGGGRFTEVTHHLLPEWHAFGMSQLRADFDGDGRMDLLMVGMNVPVASRLQHYGHARPGFDSYLTNSAAMTFGNRLFQAQPDGRYIQTRLNDPIARSGWSWGCSALDFDNDGFPDLYLANGHESKESVRDYETEFWLHDIYVGNSSDDLAAFAYFQAKSSRTRGRGMSYGGYEKNRLYWNQGGQTFIEIGYLMGVALEQDSRNVLTDDLDGDGRMDLLVTTFEVWPEVKQTLRVYRNELMSDQHWIGFRLREQGSGISPAGARITIEFNGRRAVRSIAAGDSYRSQQPAAVHFGLGDKAEVDQAEIRWANGAVMVIKHPLADRQHAVLVGQ